MPGHMKKKAEADTSVAGLLVRDLLFRDLLPETFSQ